MVLTRHLSFFVVVVIPLWQFRNFNEVVFSFFFVIAHLRQFRNFIKVVWFKRDLMGVQRL